MDEYTVYVTLPTDVTLDMVVDAGMLYLGIERDPELETDYIGPVPE